MGRLDPYYRDSRTVLFLGDCRDAMRRVPANSIDSIVTDPPYELNFLGRKWDSSGVAYDVRTWEEAYRIAKPGAWMAAFGGTRTYHRMAVAIEDAGWEIRDSLMWLYGSGMPKGLNISKALDKDAGVQQKTISHSVRKNSENKGTHALRFQNSPGGLYVPTAPQTDLAKRWQGWNTTLKPSFEPIVLAQKPIEGTFVSNVKKWEVGGINVDECRVGDEGGRTSIMHAPMDPDEEQIIYGRGLGRGIRDSVEIGGRWPGNVLLDEEAAKDLDDEYRGLRPSRYFYVAKASRVEREDGLNGTKARRENTHVTVKPVALMAWLVRLLTPKGGVVLDPFTGSGSTRLAAHMEGARFVGMELSEEHIKIAISRTGGVVGPLVQKKRSDDRWSEVFGESAELAHVVGRPRLDD